MLDDPTASACYQERVLQLLYVWMLLFSWWFSWSYSWLPLVDNDGCWFQNEHLLTLPSSPWQCLPISVPFNHTFPAPSSYSRPHLDKNSRCWLQDHQRCPSCSCLAVDESVGLFRGYLQCKIIIKEADPMAWSFISSQHHYSAQFYTYIFSAQHSPTISTFVANQPS